MPPILINEALGERLVELDLDLPAELKVWKVDIAPPLDDPKLAACLNLAEQSRANRFKRGHLRTRFMVTRAALRSLLAERLNLTPEAVPIETTDDGRPFVADSGIDFNVSHSADRALIAFYSNDQHKVGIDIEFKASARDLQGIARSVFSPTEQALLADNPHREQEIFYQLWTCKEAYLKALGTGLQIDMKRLEVDASQPNKSRFLVVPGPDPTLTLSFTPEPNYQATLTLIRSGGGQRIRLGSE